MRPIRSFIFGIDQTGAVDARGRPRALPCAFIYRDAGKWQLKAFALPKLNRQELESSLAKHSLEFRPDRSLFVVDCVLGLPAHFYGTHSRLRKWIDLTKQELHYGRAPAESFFAEILKTHSPQTLPKRELEALLGANSVFVPRPYQRNIQTGTYRFWKELASDPDWYSLIGHEPPIPMRALMLEGYPSLAWRELFDGSKRTPERFVTRLRDLNLPLRLDAPTREILHSSADACDAAVLALQAWLNPKSIRYAIQRHGTTSQRRRLEGWILGAESKLSPL